MYDMSEETDFNGRIEFKLYDGTKSPYKLVFKANLPEEPHHNVAENKVIYCVANAVKDLDASSKNWEEAFDLNQIGSDIWVGLKKRVKCFKTIDDPEYQEDPQSPKRYRLLSFQGSVESYDI